MGLRHRITPILIVILVMVGFSGISARRLGAAPPQQDQREIRITSPTNDQVVFGTVQITGSVVDAGFTFFHVEYSPDPPLNEESWRPIQPPVSQQVRNGLLAIWDTTNLEDGRYLLRLRVELGDDAEEIREVRVIIANATPTPLPTLPPTVTATALPGSPTPGPSPTPLIDQPPTRTPRPTATPGGPTNTPEPFLVEDSPLQPARLRSAAMRGVMLAAVTFFLTAVYLLIRAAFRGRLRTVIWQIRKEVIGPLINTIRGGRR